LWKLERYPLRLRAEKKTFSSPKTPLLRSKDFLATRFLPFGLGNFLGGIQRRGGKKNAPSSLIFVFHFRFQKKQRENEQEKNSREPSLLLVCRRIGHPSARARPASHDKQRQGKKRLLLVAKKKAPPIALLGEERSFSSSFLQYLSQLNSTQNTPEPAQLPLEAVIFTAAAAQRRRNRRRAEPEAAAPFENGDDERRNRIGAVVVVVDASSSSSSATPTSVFIFFPAAAAPPLPARRGVRARAPGRSPDAGAQIHTRHRRRELRDQDVSFEAF